MVILFLIIHGCPAIGLTGMIAGPEARGISLARTQEASVAEKRGDIFADADEAYLLVDG